MSMTSSATATQRLPDTRAAPGTLSSEAASDRRHARERRRRLARNARHLVIAILVLGAAVAAVLALRPRPAPIDVARTVRGPLSVVIEESGLTRVKDRFVVSAPVTGSLSRLVLEPGDVLKEGDSLAEIAPALSPLLDERTRAQAEARLGAALSALGQAHAQASRAAIEKEQAQQELERTRRLSASGSLAAQVLEQAEFAVRMRTQEQSSAEFASKVAAEEVRVARMALGADRGRSARERFVGVVSPVSGQVLRVHQESAGVVQAGTPLVEVGDAAALEVVVDLLTTDAVHVRPGTTVVIRGWGGEQSVAGKVRRIEPSAFTRPSALGLDEQRVNVIVAMTEPRERWAALGDGYRVEVRLVLWQSEEVLKVQLGAVFRHGRGWAVFRVEDGTARLTPVEVGHRGETEAEIVKGLDAGALVAVHPSDRVKDGTHVEAR
jgi:HlyD family secretion protein